MALQLYGIPNCDTVKKARTFLTAAGVAHDFHDYKKAGVPSDALARWVARWGWEAVLNRAGTTFKALPDADKQGLDAGKAMALMLANSSMIKRPIVEGDGVALIGFKPDAWAGAF
ncbi:arsenate reductase [Sandarakinorhabdus limnophila]|uniref:arsenate reductase n=1 Tax=Sandarakinorhabdus limnophila TaxID=210512 RepID=UPI0026EA1C50|nr:arsenate reductase [Sandarakinorhabdus limnophila]MCM0032194.1 arsenate reductase [Sandarakinorhabdus limnophila]